MNSDKVPAGESVNAEFLENLYQQYRSNPTLFDPSWQQYFQSVDLGKEERSLPSANKKDQIIEAYRMYGHLFAKINPIALEEPKEPVQLQLDTKGEEDLVKRLRSIYCDGIGYEYKGIVSPEMEEWIETRIESPGFRQQLSAAQRGLILEYLNKSELFESFLHMKYVGQKRFSLEGGESLIPMLALMIEKGTEEGMKEIVLGMAHRGRLNVLSNIMNKPYYEIFSEFEEGYAPMEGTGDVKYHKGYTSDTIIANGGRNVKITLTPNPSHLESIDPVVEGQSRAKQFLSNDIERKEIVPVLIHGDASLSGQGVIYETLQLSKLQGYTTGGTIHFVINNQIGFTTIPRDLRSTLYCTDIAKSFGVPAFHVDAEDPEGCVLASLLAFELRKRFHCDVFIDLNCYRKYGHNEGDEPAFTQPIEYSSSERKNP